MKNIAKTAIAILMLAVGITSNAQDTIHTRAFPEHYQHPLYWPDSSEWDSLDVIITSHATFGYEGHQVGILKHADSSLTVYGIAASLVGPFNKCDSAALANLSREVLDTSMAALYDEQLRLWQLNGDNVCQVGEDLTVRISTEAPEYYWDLHVTPGNMRNRPVVMPMFERYFNEPVVVHDSFLVGKPTVNGLVPDGGAIYDPDRGLITRRNWSITIMAFMFDSPNDLIHSGQIVMSCLPKMDDQNLGEWGWERGDYLHYIIYPILTPNPDRDTSGVGIQRIEDRLVGVMPNPATKEVKVVSSFGLRHIDAYDAAGRRILSRDAQGLQTHIDVGAWPRGVYTLHILTPAGTTVKKLLVE